MMSYILLALTCSILYAATVIATTFPTNLNQRFGATIASHSSQIKYLQQQTVQANSQLVVNQITLEQHSTQIAAVTTTANNALPMAGGTITGNLQVNGNHSVNGNVQTGNDVIVGANFSVGGVVEGTLTANGDIVVNTNFSVAGEVEGTLTLSADLIVGGNLGVDGTIEGDQTVNGTLSTTSGNNITAGNDLIATANVGCVDVNYTGSLNHT
jgi:cytoskeletal protein CcmA (bactofilin family)